MPARLKSLELHGYKTFASRTPFEFGSRVTAIVGPNGSGKSNIADALRWVLGEQSFSLLRGKKTEDMIFAGSEQRARSGMAAATVIFDNSDNWLPIDFSEVAVTRRAYRDGENEYLLNNQKVRLRDVSELLAQSGLAERTYTIIGQGLVDAALALRAEERRRLFEEAAGIGLHRARREEALRRLEATLRNLDRVQDILAELQPRLHSLERQARRAQEYEQVKADLRVLLRDWYGYHWHSAQKDLTEAKEVARLQDIGLDKARQAQSLLDQQLSGLRDRLQELRTRLNGWHRQSAQQHTQRENASRGLAVADERQRSLAEQRLTNAVELNRLSQELLLEEGRLTGVASELEELEADRREAQGLAEIAQQALIARQQEHAAAEKEVQQARQSLAALMARQAQLQARLAERKAQAERSSAGLAGSVQAVIHAEAELQAAVKRLQVSDQAHQQAEAGRRQAEDELRARRDQAGQVESARRAALEQRSEQQGELARRRAQLEVLEQAERDMAGYASGARLLLQAARQGRAPGLRGALSRELEVPAELEAAISGALGDLVDAVVLEQSAGGEAALDILLNSGGRGALLPLESLRPAEPLGALAGDGVLGVAAALVKTPADLRPAVDLLLGQVLVVRDRATARRVLPDQPATARVVTLRGEVFHASGLIAAGSDGKAGTLSRPRQQRELKAQLAEAESRAAALEQELQRLEQQLAGLNRASDQLGQAVRAARRQEEQASAAYQQEKMALEQARRQKIWQEEQRARLEGEIRQGEAEAAQTAGELARLEGELQPAHEQLRGRISALGELALDELQTQAAHWDTRTAVAERAVGDALRRWRDQQAALERLKKSAAGLQERQEQVEAAGQRLQSEQAELRRVEIAVGETLEALRALIEPAETELDAAEGEQSGLQAAESEARQALNLAEHFHAQARLTLTRRQEALDNLRQRIEEDFGLVAFEYAEQVSGPTPLPLVGMVEQLPRVSQLSNEVDEALKRQRAQLRRIGPVNPEAQVEYRQVKDRYQFMTEQVEDLRRAEADIRQVISELDGLMQREFRKTFTAVAGEFHQIFNRLFGGGSARLVLTDPDDLTNTGIDIEARLPGRREQGLVLLSGGERSLTATALVFALLRVAPTPFCVLDEVDAMLDEANVGRFRELLRELSLATQFIIITHNRTTVQAAEVIYGVTMGPDSASQVVSLRLDEVDGKYSN